MNIKLYAAQTKPAPGALKDNTDNILRHIADAKKAGADIIAFSYGSLTGLNMKGLMENSQFVESVQGYNDLIKAAAGDIRILLPTVIPEGEACMYYYKDEEIVFPVSMDENFNNDAERIVINGTEISVNPDIPDSELCIFTAPIVFSKEIDFESLLMQLLAGFDKTVLCLNSVGFSNGAVFVGSSFGVSEEKLFYREESFCEKGALLDLSDKAGAPIYDKKSGIEAVFKAICMSISAFVESAGFPGVCLGMSGGIDSAVVGALAVNALGADRVRCLIMPSEFSSAATMGDAEVICRRLNVRYDVIDIKPLVESYVHSLAPVFGGSLKEITMENLQARTRGMLNMALSNDQGHAVLVTGNKSELAMGYATMYGDTAGALAPIMDLYKHEVYELADYINRISKTEVIPQTIIDRAPSAELRPNQKDSDTLPDYKILDALLYMLIEENATVREAAEETGADIALAEKVFGMLCRAEFKRHQYPLGVIVSKSSFGFDAYWDYPIMNKYRP
ncbi:MAG: NAD(+) synthase [Abditibacteriota bacterium]|nr:NAD(+) synthase [Abditibacteriota bacterium]